LVVSRLIKVFYAKPIHRKRLSMKQKSPLYFIVSLAIRFVKIAGFLAGGFLLYRNRKKLRDFFTRQSFIISASYALVIAFIALFYRLIMVLNWILQQGR